MEIADDFPIEDILKRAKNLELHTLLLGFEAQASIRSSEFAKRSTFIAGRSSLRPEKESALALKRDRDLIS
ncbi:MAG TPA: hypothetical protein VGM54_04395 [Chthoniobacter sp.]|jgi:hypothetical protein